MSPSLCADDEGVKRRSIQVIKSRLEDIEVGDAVNRDPDAEQGWFVVDAISTLFNGHIQLADETEQLTVSGGHKDMVGVQLIEEVELDDRGVIVAAAVATTVVAAPTTPAATAVSTEDAPEQASDPVPDVPAALAGAAPEPVDLEAEAAAAAAIATEMDAPTPGAGRGLPGVDLGLVASLLENLDVGEAPEISTEISDAPMFAEPTIPPNAVAVDGGALPDKPSYKNPIVVPEPEGGMLPRRSRAA